jgi:hypothetical protein
MNLKLEDKNEKKGWCLKNQGKSLLCSPYFLNDNILVLLNLKRKINFKTKIYFSYFSVFS